MDDARIQRLIAEKGVQSFITSEEWVDFYLSLRQKVSSASPGDPANVFNQICEISKQAIQARADELRSGDAYRHTRLKYTAISALPLGKATAGRKQTKNFENETLDAFGLGDKVYLSQIRENFHNHFHSKSSLAIGVVGSAAGGALAMAGMTPLGFAVGRSVRVLEGAWAIRKTMRKMIELAMTLALAIHTEIFIPLVMAELWSPPTEASEDSCQLFLCRGCFRPQPPHGHFSRCSRCLGSGAMFCSRCSEANGAADDHASKCSARATGEIRVPRSIVKIVYIDPPGSDNEKYFKCFSCDKGRSPDPFFPTYQGRSGEEAKECYKCFFSLPPLHGFCSVNIVRSPSDPTNGTSPNGTGGLPSLPISMQLTLLDISAGKSTFQRAKRTAVAGAKMYGSLVAQEATRDIRRELMSRGGQFVSRTLGSLAL